MLKTNKINENEVILVPVAKDFKGKEFYQCVSYDDHIDLVNNSNKKNTELIKKILLKNYKYSKIEDFNWSIYINPNYSDLIVIDFDDLKETIKKINYLCSNNSEFNLKWNIFWNEVLQKTFSVSTPSGGYHFYLRRKSKAITTRIIGSIRMSEFLDSEKSKECFRIFGKDFNKIKIDYISSGVVNAPNIELKNMLKKGECKNRSYKTKKDNDIISIDDTFEPLLTYIFKPQASLNGKKIKRPNGKNKPIYGNHFLSFLDLKTKKILFETISLEKASLSGDVEDFDLESTQSQYKKMNDLLNETKASNIGAEEEIRKTLIKIENSFQILKEQKIKETLCSSIKTEYIYNILNKQNISKSYTDKEILPLFPNKLIENVQKARKGQRSENEMAFITHLVLRHFDPAFICYLVLKLFPEKSKAKTESGFLEQALEIAQTLKRHPEYLNNPDKIWIKILQCICKLRQINFYALSKSNSEKLRLAIDTFYQIASITNSFEIRTPLKFVSLISNGRISKSTIKKYLIELESSCFFEKIVWEMDSEGKKSYPTFILLKDISNVSNIPLLDYPRFVPQDAYQNLAFLPKIGERGFQIIELIRTNFKITTSEIYLHFSEIKDFRRVIYKQLNCLKNFNIIKQEHDNWELTEKIFNNIYNEIADQDKYYKNLASKKKIKRNPMINRIINLKKSDNYLMKLKKAS
ncbi:hypothetical protein CLV96_0299 [Leptospira meyeri]|uniref:Uncharacterized protein n=1 Tax=Leptospira meyeri TaxID=29508 RepID=A0A4R8MUF5_LEPME|nr:hypothetical protein [Leptospira meyeri]EKJ85363.1 bifunctional DNA primase/polymerase, N-terminal domain protein [Leptospira meyeri serovar Hardjo str. Went 5]TDY71337.1 hypothetical protein CLV96_0299 [Leptospira meyeri]